MNGPPLRPLILSVADHPWFRRIATAGPGRRVARRFVAGETLDQAMAAAERLRARGAAAMLDHLGENVHTPQQATAAAAAYVEAVRRLAATPAINGGISVKLTQLGLELSVERCADNLGTVLDAAEPEGILVMIDMEHHVYVDDTLLVLRILRQRHRNVGVCLQSYLRRSPADVFDLPETAPVRLVKGAYLEPRSVAFTSRREVDATFARIFATLVRRGHEVHVATHDPDLIEGARRWLARNGLDPSRVEYQMLYGIRRDLQDRLVAEGERVRVYVPYGSEWYPYLTRRLAERPANMWFFVSNLVRSER